jgi:hypothetical protein
MTEKKAWRIAVIPGDGISREKSPGQILKPFPSSRESP